MEYQVLKVAELQPFAIRDIRASVVNKLKDRIKEGYNPARPLSVVRDNGKYIVADGNHRLQVLKELNIEEVPCVIRDGNPYSLAVNCNQDEDTYAPMDLFDWLDIIDKLKDEGLTQQKIGEQIGKSRATVSQYIVLSNSIATGILVLAREHQEDRVAGSATNVATFDFTEGWFRNSDLYDLNEEYQLAFMEWFIEQKLDVKNNKISKYVNRLSMRQKGKEIVKAKLISDVDDTLILENIDKDLYSSEEQILKAVERLNEQYLEKQKIQIKHQDAFEMMKGMPHQSVDLIVTDPPYNAVEEEWDNFESEEDYLGFIKKVIVDAKKVLKEEYNFFMFIDAIHFARVEMMMIEEGYKINSRIVWVRKNMSMGRDVRDKFISQYEMILHSGTKPLNFPSDWGNERGDVQEFAVPQSNFKDKKLHKTQKPIDLIKRLVRLGSDIGDLVLDPFCGSGTTAKACEGLNRKCITCDTNKDYIDIAMLRVFGGDE